MPDIQKTFTNTPSTIIKLSNFLEKTSCNMTSLTHFVDVSKLQIYPSKTYIKLKAIGKQTNSQYAVPSLKVETWVIF